MESSSNSINSNVLLGKAKPVPRLEQVVVECLHNQWLLWDWAGNPVGLWGMPGNWTDKMCNFTLSTNYVITFAFKLAFQSPGTPIINRFTRALWFQTLYYQPLQWFEFPVFTKRKNITKFKNRNQRQHPCPPAHYTERTSLPYSLHIYTLDLIMISINQKTHNLKHLCGISLWSMIAVQFILWFIHWKIQRFNKHPRYYFVIQCSH